jgi:hypothetical protein
MTPLPIQSNSGKEAGCSTPLPQGTAPKAEVYQAARLNVLDVSIVVVVADASFDQKTTVERLAVCEALQQSVGQSDPGTDALLVWQDADGRMKFIAPPRQARFFQVMRYDQIYAQIDRTITLTFA